MVAKVANVFTTISLGIFLVPLIASAQFAPNFNNFQIDFDSLSSSGFGAPATSISLSPNLPQPLQEVEATINDFSSNLYGSSISWTLDGEVVPEAANKRTVTFTAAAAGVTQTLEATLTTPSGQTERYSTTITPAYLDIILEPQTRVPDFYQGRALPSVGSIINATALVDDGTSLRSTDLIYTWRVGQQVLERGPLRGGYKVSFPMPMGDEVVLSVSVTEFDGTPVASRAVLVRSVMPEVHFYEVSALYGIEQVALNDDFSLIGNTATVRAEPYFLDTRVFNDPNVLEWKVANQRTTSGGGNPYEVTLQRTGALGTAQLDFHVRDLQQVLQGSKANLTINF